jgi:hypothetical protein
MGEAARTGAARLSEIENARTILGLIEFLLARTGLGEAAPPPQHATPNDRLVQVRQMRFGEPGPVHVAYGG